MGLIKWLKSIIYRLMPNILKPTTVVKQITTQTTQGEVTVNLNLTITLCVDQTGEMSLKVAPTKATPEYETHIPDWGPVDNADLIEFGKDVE